MIVCALVLTVATTTIVIQPTQCNPAQAPSAPPTGLDSSSSSSDKSGPKIEAKAEAQAVREQHPDQQQQQAKQASPEARSSGAPAASAAVGPASSDAQPKQQQSEADQRKGRASEEPASSAETPALAGSKDEKPKESAEKQTSGSSSSSKLAESAKPEEKKSGKQQSQPQLKQQQQLSAKSGASSGSGNKSRLPLNLGTVTSTGSGGPAHYMSKHDAYSAIAEKHGALAQDSVRNTHRVNTDRRSHLQRFGGIQRASGIGDMLSPFKGVTESDLARSEYLFLQELSSFLPDEESNELFSTFSQIYQLTTLPLTSFAALVLSLSIVLSKSLQHLEPRCARLSRENSPSPPMWPLQCSAPWR